MEDLNAVIRILKRILPQLIDNPLIMEGCDVSGEEIEDIIKTKELSINVLEHLGGDTFFEVYFDEFGITEEEAEELSLFLQKTARYYLEELKREFSYIRE